jgi:hypothetical protein
MSSKKSISVKGYFSRAKIFGYVLIAIVLGIVGYFAYTYFAG